MFSKRFLLVISMICIDSMYCQSANVDSVVVRLSKPSQTSEYSPEDDNNYNDGDSIVINDLDNVWILVGISTAQKDDKYKITIEGNNNGGKETFQKKFGRSSSGIKYKAHRMDVESFKNAGSTSMSVKCEIIGSSMSSKEITVSISFDSSPVNNIEVSDLSVRLLAPVNIDDYSQDNPDNFGNEESITIEDLNDLVYFVVLFENWSLEMEYKYKFTIEGNKGGLIDDSGFIEGEYQDIVGNMNGFENSNEMIVKCEILDPNNNNVVSFKEIIIILKFNLKDAFVSNLSVRLSAPQNDDEYKESVNSIIINGNNEFDLPVYFAAIFDNWVSGMKYKYTIFGNRGGFISKTGNIESTGEYIGKLLKFFEKSTEMTVKCEILDSNNNLIVGSTKEITIALSFVNIIPKISNFSVSTTAPGEGDFSAYFESNPNNVVDGETITITNLEETVYFIVTFDPSQNDYDIKFIVEGDNGEILYEFEIPGMNWANEYGAIISELYFSESLFMIVTCQALNAEGIIVDSKSIQIGLNWDLDNRRRLNGKSRLLSMNLN